MYIVSVLLNYFCLQLSVIVGAPLRKRDIGELFYYSKEAQGNISLVGEEGPNIMERFIIGQDGIIKCSYQQVYYILIHAISFQVLLLRLDSLLATHNQVTIINFENQHEDYHKFLIADIISGAPRFNGSDSFGEVRVRTQGNKFQPQPAIKRSGSQVSYF